MLSRVVLFAALSCLGLRADDVLLQSHDVNALVNKGIQLAHEQHYAEAESYYKRALVLLPPAVAV